MKRKKAFVLDECVACGSCVKACPFESIEIFKGIIAKVDFTKCVGCGRCSKSYPALVIEIRYLEVV